jgi:hypothetical protein
VNAPRAWPNSSDSNRRRRDGGHVRGEEAAVAPLAERVDELGDDLLARPRLPQEEDRDVRVRKHLDPAEDRLELGVAGDERLEARVVGERRRLVREVGPQHPRHHVFLERLEQVVVRAGLDGADRLLDVVHDGRHHDADVRPPDLDPMQQLDPVQTRHPDVEEDEADFGVLVEVRLDVLGDGLGDRRVPDVPEQARMVRGDRAVVVDHEHRIGGPYHSRSRIKVRACSADSRTISSAIIPNGLQSEKIASSSSKTTPRRKVSGSRSSTQRP